MCSESWSERSQTNIAVENISNIDFEGFNQSSGHVKIFDQPLPGQFKKIAILIFCEDDDLAAAYKGFNACKVNS